MFIIKQMMIPFKNTQLIYRRLRTHANFYANSYIEFKKKKKYKKISHKKQLKQTKTLLWKKNNYKNKTKYIHTHAVNANFRHWDSTHEHLQRAAKAMNFCTECEWVCLYECLLLTKNQTHLQFRMSQFQTEEHLRYIGLRFWNSF